MKTLYDAAGRPIEESLLREEISAPVDYVRPIWTDTAADKLTPDNLARILQLAREGDAHEFLTLADDMEEREPHYGSVLRTRKLAVSGIEAQVKPADSKDSNAVKIAEAVEALIQEPEFGDLVADLLDALGKGYSVCEIIWDRSGNVWRPEKYKWRDPRFFRFDILDHEKLKLLDEENMLTGIDLPAYKFIVHYPHLKSGLKISSGLARLAAVSYMCKAYTIKDMMRFVEVFGMPLRIGKYKAGANKGDIDTLRRAVVNLGYDAAAVIPESMSVEFVKTEAGGSSNSNPFIDIAGWLDSQVSKGVLGQTMTTDNGSSRSQAEVHDEVRQDIKTDDARKLANTINRELIEPFVILNFGHQEKYPKVYFPVEDSADIEALSKALSVLVPQGLKVSQSWVRSQIGAPAPDEEDEILAPPSTAVQEIKEPNSERPAEIFPEDELDEIVSDELNDWERKVSPVIDPVLKLVQDSQSYDEFVQKLPELAEDMDIVKILKSLAKTAFQARGMGDAQDES